ncbi:MAG TPA: DUF1186 domain-containing protein [Verrucomicrobiae bacterium]|nr:DUF1186 domain-containing protein [Verrucomicrobiae bacterium]
MIPFHSRFPELAASETRCLRVLDPGGKLPVGEYGYLEHYCNEPGCDCRRVLLCVTRANAPHTVLATINYGWESAEFYTRWMHGDAQAGRDLASACLDPFQPQSQYADYLLDHFQKAMITDPAYVARLALHYQMFKQDLLKRRPMETPTPPATAIPKMTIADILRQLQHVPDHGDFAPYRNALHAAIEQREAITPELIAAIDRATDAPDDYLRRQHDNLHLFAIYLLAQFRETRALDAFLRFFSLPGDAALDLTGDMVTENGAAVIASVCGGDPAPLLRLIHDEAVNEFVRGQAIDALLVQHLWGERPREAVVADLRQLFHTLPRPGDPYLWAALVSVVCDFEARELLPEARLVLGEQLADESIIGPESLDELESPAVGHLPLPAGETHSKLFMERNAPIDAIAECSAWLCFRDKDAGFDPWGEDDAPDLRLDDPGNVFDLPPEPYIAPPKIGRNEPCPCGSGKKYKKCCGRN